MLSLTLSFCADTLIFAFFPLLSKHQWQLLWEEMSTAPQRPHWICQWRAAEILLAVLVQFCAHVQANAGSEPACSSCSVLVQPWWTWKTTCVHRWLQGSLSTAQRRAVTLRRVTLERTWLIVLHSRLAETTGLPRSTWATTNPQAASPLARSNGCSPRQKWWCVCAYALLPCSADCKKNQG